MKYILEIPDNKRIFAEEFFKSISFIKKIEMLETNQIINKEILKSIDDYENNKIIPTNISLQELKSILNA